MPRPLKITAGIVAALLGLVLILALYLMLTFDPNDYRDEIISQVEAETGRTLTLEDSIELQLFPWIGLKLGATQLSGPENFASENFIRIDSAHIKVRLLALLQQRLEVDTITLQGLDVNLISDEDGRTNWDFSRTPGEQGTEETAPAAGTETAAAVTPVKLHINGLDVRDAAVNWYDASSQTRVSLSQLAFRTGPIDIGAPVDVDVSFRLGGTPLAEQKLALHLGGRLLYEPDQQRLAINKLNLQVGEMVLGGDVEASQLTTTAAFSGQVEIPGFQPRPLLQQLGVVLPDARDPKAWDSVSARLKFSGDVRHIDVSELKFRLDDSTLTGHAQVKLEPHLSTAFTLAIDTLDVDRYLPASSTPEVDTTPPAATDTTANLDLPLEPLRALDLQGQMTIGNIRVAGLRAGNIIATLSARDGLISVQPLQADLYQGKTTGALRLDARRALPRFTIQQQLDDFQAKPFLQDLLDSDLVSGQAALKMDLSTQGNSVDDLTRHLNGNARFSFADGAVKGLNIAALVREAKAKIEKRPPPPPSDIPAQTDFSTLSATIMVKNGVVDNQDLSAQAPLLRISGKGQADLVKQRIDYHVRAKIVEDIQGQGGADLASLQGSTIPIRISGPLTAPDIKLDSEAIRKHLRREAREKIQEKVQQQREEVKSELKQRLKKLFK